jgi:hypothetical protein
MSNFHRQQQLTEAPRRHDYASIELLIAMAGAILIAAIVIPHILTA